MTTTPRYPGENPGSPAASHQPLAPPGSFGRPHVPVALGTLTWWVVAVAALHTLVAVAMAIAAFPSRDRYLEDAQLGISAFDTWASIDALNIVVYPSLLFSYIATCVWLQRVRANVELTVPGAPHRRSKGWVWGAWVVPFVNLVFPRQIVCDVLRTRVNHPGRELAVNLWWGSFIVAMIAQNVAGRAIPFQGQIDTGQVEALPALHVVAAIITMISLGLWIRVILMIQKDQHELVSTAESAGPE